MTGAVLLLALLGGVTWVLVEVRTSTGDWWPAATPQRLDYCGRRYLPEGVHVSGRGIAAQAARTDPLDGSVAAPAERVGTASLIDRRAVWASVEPGATRARLGIPCAMGIYLQVGPDDYIPYGLTGGP